MSKSATQKIDERIRELGGWRGETLASMRALIVEADPEAIEEWKWNSPFHVFAQYVKMTFFNGASLKAIPLGGTPKSKEARWIDIREGDKFDEVQMAKWVKQAAALQGWTP